MITIANTIANIIPTTIAIIPIVPIAAIEFIILPPYIILEK